MLCDRCGQREAVYHQTVIVNGNKQESHVCEECAQEMGFQGMTTPSFSFPGNLTIGDLLSSFLGGLDFGPAIAAPKQAEPRCSHCGMTYSQFAESGRLGCAHCYDDLESALVPLIKRVQGTTNHAGKAPKRTGGLIRKQRDLEELRRKQLDAVRNENYEEAARMRDAIKEMENQLNAGGDSQ
ncbi:MAG: UvrB/UvrC motif-containing protein [Mycobacterium leprae]